MTSEAKEPSEAARAAAVGIVELVGEYISENRWQAAENLIATAVDIVAASVIDTAVQAESDKWNACFWQDGNGKWAVNMTTAGKLLSPIPEPTGELCEPIVADCDGCGQQIQNWEGVVAYTEGTFCNRACFDVHHPTTKTPGEPKP